MITYFLFGALEEQKKAMEWSRSQDGNEEEDEEEWEEVNTTLFLMMTATIIAVSREWSQVDRENQ